MFSSVKDARGGKLPYLALEGGIIVGVLKLEGQVYDLETTRALHDALYRVQRKVCPWLT